MISTYVQKENGAISIQDYMVDKKGQLALPRMILILTWCTLSPHPRTASQTLPEWWYTKLVQPNTGKPSMALDFIRCLGMWPGWSRNPWNQWWIHSVPCTDGYEVTRNVTSSRTMLRGTEWRINLTYVNLSHG